MTKKQYLIVDGKLRSVKPGVDPNAAVEALRTKGRTVHKVKSPPSLKTMGKWMADGVAKTTNGCRIEPDGTCPHQHQSWLLVLGFI